MPNPWVSPRHDQLILVNKAVNEQERTIGKGGYRRREKIFSNVCRTHLHLREAEMDGLPFVLLFACGREVFNIAILHYLTNTVLKQGANAMIAAFTYNYKTAVEVS
jgi:hypothetical protein